MVFEFSAWDAEEGVGEDVDEGVQVETFVPLCEIQAMVVEFVPTLQRFLLQLLRPHRGVKLSRESVDAFFDKSRNVVVVAGRMEV